VERSENARPTGEEEKGRYSQEKKRKEDVSVLPFFLSAQKICSG
jgi:hypothetical protein